MSSIFPARLIKCNLRTQSDFLRNLSSIWSKFNKIFRFKGLANASNRNKKFEESRRFLKIKLEDGTK